MFYVLRFLENLHIDLVSARILCYASQCLLQSVEQLMASKQEEGKDDYAGKTIAMKYQICFLFDISYQSLPLCWLSILASLLLLC